MITVMKASAGSGKTYALAHRYIDMLLGSSDKDEYRHILAVTFTNKATDEMKSRIIEELFKLDTPKSRLILADILHDYSSFAVSTIDKFFQQTLRAFARELGQFSRYQVELDKNALVDEAVDTILDELNPEDEQDRKMVDFIVENMEDRLGEGGRLDVEGALKETARQLKSETFSRKCAEIGMDKDAAYDGEQLSTLKKTCHTVIRKFEEKVRGQASAVQSSMSAAGLETSDFNRGWIGFIEKYVAWKRGSKAEISDAVRAKIENPSAETWFAKARQNLYSKAYEAVGEKLVSFLALWESDDFKAFNTAVMLLGQVYGLGVAARLFKAFDRVAKEKNVVCLDESNSLLRDIIDGSDAPFVYEKTGVRFRTFLLDEFQDTSSTQWENFLPLLRESEGGKGFSEEHTFDNLIVGDVKQSIYRWRDSDWSLLDHKVEECFEGEIHNSPLNNNWRSLNEIIEFNNKLYPALAASLDSINAVPDGMHSVSEIYSDCAQTPGKLQDQEGGSVDVEFVDGEDEQLQRILETVRDLKDNHNASYGDIAVLVRWNRLGTSVANVLIDNGVPVVTDASLRMKNSISVRRLTSMMSYVCNPNDAVGSYVAKSYGMTGVPSSYHNLTDLAESLYKILCVDPSCREDCRKEALYIISFMDFVADYSNANGNNLTEFLSYWKEKDPNVNTTSSKDAVNIITIHKSKGLSFPYVIVPYVEKMALYDNRRTRDWAVPECKSGDLSPCCDRLFYVPLNEKAENSYFGRTYGLEKFNQGVDAINLLYVATTRAEKGMKILADMSGKTVGRSMAKLLSDFCGGTDYHAGSILDFARPKEDADVPAQMEYELTYPFYNIDERLSIRPYAADFFEEAGEGFESLSWRERGIVLHDILGRVRRPCDLEKAVYASVADGSLPESARPAVLERLSAAVAEHPEFFPSDSSVRVLTEKPVIDSFGVEHKPDRVLILPDGKVRIIDYKFGNMKAEYNDQIARYKAVFKAMGYKDVEACLWLVYQNKIF